MFDRRIFNFSAGPATLPEAVLKKAQSELLNYQNTGMSIMEMSHRGKPFMAVIEQARAGIRDLLSVPDTHDILFLQGGASLQFSMVPINLYQTGKDVDFIQTGSWTKKALKELKKIGTYREVASSADKNFSYIPKIESDQLNPEASYTYIASNNTIFGTQFQDFPDSPSPLVADMSSDILSRELDISQFGLIFAGAQKNIGPSGVAVVIIRRDLLDRCADDVPSMLQYRIQSEGESLYNTPPTFGIYMIGLVCDWLTQQGGLAAIEKRNQEKAKLLYDFIDESTFYKCPTEVGSRSVMNPVCRIDTDKSEELEALFVKEAEKAGLSGLKGHRSVGGLRASIYNAFPIEGVQALVDFMKTFAEKNQPMSVSVQ